MTNTKATQLDDNPALEAIRARARGANINEQTLLATDYLNHFNEIVMTLEMIPDMSELLEEAQTWLPKGYREHLGDSTPSWEADAPRIMG